MFFPILPASAVLALVMGLGLTTTVAAADDRRPGSAQGLAAVQAADRYELSLEHLRRGFRDVGEGRRGTVSAADAPELISAQIALTTADDNQGVDRPNVSSMEPLEWSIAEKAGYAYGMRLAHKTRRRAQQHDLDHTALQRGVLDQIDAALER